MPLVWLARLLGMPLAERVAGSDLFEALRELAPSSVSRAGRIQPVGPEVLGQAGGGDTLQGMSEPVAVYFFGGADGAAIQACENLNAEPGMLRCVGAYGPGFGSLDEMSAPSIIERINSSGADFLVVALGARKGQAWIVRNLPALTVPVVSHLGAVVNFVAGHIRRAPRGVARAGLEWAWRVWEEPGLWRRYWRDGTALFHFFVMRVLPYAAWRQFSREKGRGATARVSASRELGDAPRGGEEGAPIESSGVGSAPPVTVLAVAGVLTASNLAPVRAAFREAASAKADVVLDLRDASTVDGAFLGLLLMLEKHVRRRGGRLTLANPSRAVARTFYWNGVDYLLG
jgi:N-acetylglucosaminyldiphosphoundecaprenol N-acetyl-beta-D-mannosaminyltransferase